MIACGGGAARAIGGGEGGAGRATAVAPYASPGEVAESSRVGRAKAARRAPAESAAG